MNIQITRAEEADIPSVVDVLNSALHYKIDHNDHAWGDENAELYNAAEVQGMMKNWEVYKATVDNKTVGTVSLSWDDENTWGQNPPDAGYIHHLAVSEGFHGQGVGEQILDWSVKKAVENGRKLLRLDCDEDNELLCNYYQKAGFIKVNTKQKENGKTAALFEKTI